MTVFVGNYCHVEKLCTDWCNYLISRWCLSSKNHPQWYDGQWIMRMKAGCH